MGEVKKEGGSFRHAQTPQPLEQKDLCKGDTLQYALCSGRLDPNRGWSTTFHMSKYTIIST